MLADEEQKYMAAVAAAASVPFFVYLREGTMQELVNPNPCSARTPSNSARLGSKARSIPGTFNAAT
jgi:hypothetical protein